MSDINIRKLYSLYFCEWLLDVGEENSLSLGEAFGATCEEEVAFKPRGVS